MSLANSGIKSRNDKRNQLKRSQQFDEYKRDGVEADAGWE